MRAAAICGSGRAIAQSRAARRLSCSRSRRSSQRRWSSPRELGAARSASSMNGRGMATDRAARRARRASRAAYSRMVSSIANRGSPSALSSTRTRLWSASSPIRSMTSPPTSDAGPQTASAASSWNPPANTDSRSSRRRAAVVEQVVAPGDRAAQGLLALGQVARARRQDVEVVLEPARGSGPGERSLIRAAASSMASGMPCRRARSRPRPGRSSFVTVKPGLTATARAMNSRTAAYWLTAAASNSRTPRGQVEPLASRTGGRSRAAPAGPGPGTPARPRRAARPGVVTRTFRSGQRGAGRR